MSDTDILRPGQQPGSARKPAKSNIPKNNRIARLLQET